MTLQAKKPMNQISRKRLEQFGGRMPFNSLEKPGEKRKALKAGPNTIGPDADTVDAVTDREQHSCCVCGKWLEPDGRGKFWSVHHRRRVRTDNRMSVLIAVCGGAAVHGCHQEIHDNVAKAQDAGWLVKRGEDTTQKPMAHSQYGWVVLLDDGGWSRVEAEFIPASGEESDEHPF